MKDYNQAIQINPNDAFYYNNRAIVRDKLNDNEGSIKDINRAIQINPNNALFYKNKGQFYDNKNKKQDAILNYEQASNLYLKQGNMEEYQKVREKIKKLNSLLWWL
ncbi:MAG: hypothetical protein C4323_21195 [Mastigocladus sp. ERB_26_2]